MLSHPPPPPPPPPPYPLHPQPYFLPYFDPSLNFNNPYNNTYFLFYYHHHPFTHYSLPNHHIHNNPPPLLLPPPPPPQLEDEDEHTRLVRRPTVYSPPPRLRRYASPNPNSATWRTKSNNHHRRPRRLNKTSVMIRNIPNNLRRDDLIKWLDLYCMEHQLEYDFLYLPMDFGSHNNKGYSFVNFTSSKAASRIMYLLDGHKWRDSQNFLNVKSSNKICKLNWARIQGKEELIRHFQESRFCCSEDEYLPVTFSPPRNGSSSLSNPTTVGTLLRYQVQQRRVWEPKRGAIKAGA